LTGDSTQYPKYRWLILIAAAFTYVNAQIVNLSIAPVLDVIAKDLDITQGVAHNLESAFLFSGCILMFTIGGAIGDRIGILPTLLLGLLVAVVPAALLPWIGNSYTSMFWIRIIQGLSPGLIFPVMGAIIAIWFPLKEKGLATGLMSAAVAAGSVGGTLGAANVFHLPTVHTWQQMSAWVSVIGWADVVFIIFLLILPKPLPPTRQKSAVEHPQLKEYLIALIAPITLMIILVNFMSSWNMHCLYTVSPTFLKISDGGAGYGLIVSQQLMLNVTLISGILGPVICGFFVDRIFKGNTLQVFTIGFILCFIFMFAIKTPSVYASKSLISVALIMAGFGVQFAMPAVYIFIAKSFKHRIMAKMTGLVMGIGTLGGVLGIKICGVAYDAYNNYNLAYTIIALAALAGLVFTFILHKTKPLTD
jgi:MFS family permease